jgi:hypothetical protein
MHIVLEHVRGKFLLRFNGLVDDITASFSRRAKISRTLCPSHLKCRWDYQSHWAAGRVRHDIGEVPLRILLDEHSPESVGQIDFG